MKEGMQQKLQARLDVIRSELVEKGLKPGHIEMLTDKLLQPMVAKYAALEFITDLIIDKNLSVEEFEVLNACGSKFFINPMNFSDYIDIIRKYEITTDKVELLGKIGISLVGKVKTVADFDSVMETISKNPITEAQCSLLKDMHVVKTLEDFKSAVEIISKHPLGEAHFKIFMHFLHYGSSFKAYADLVSKHNLNKDQLDGVAKAIDRYLPIVIDMKTLDQVMSNIEKYGQPNQPLKAWFWEKLGYADEVKVVETKVATNAVHEINDELVTHIEGQGD